MRLNKRKLGMQYGFEAYFRNQDRTPKGKVGIVFGHMGVPEDYEFDFYNIYMTHLFQSFLPPLIAGIVLKDTGTVLSDPNNPVPEEEFKPQVLMDAHGNDKNKKGIPYVNCQVKWVPPKKGKSHDNGYFLYQGEGKFGAPNIAQKSGCKIISWYYHSLLTPSMKCPYLYQVNKIYDDVTKKLSETYPSDKVAWRLAPFVYKDQLQNAIEELLTEGCQTILYCSMGNPVFSDFEEYNSTFPFISDTVDKRAKVIFADQSGATRHIQEVRYLMLNDQLKQLPENASVFIILSRHGHPFKKETMDWRGAFCRLPLEEGVKAMMENWKGKWDYCWSNDEFTEGIRFETKQAYEIAISEGYDYVIEIPTDFLYENTDLMIHHARKKFLPFSTYSQYNPVDYPDWDQPLVRKFVEGKTTGIYLGVPVGERYRPYVVRGIFDSVSSILNFKERHQIGY